MNQRAIVADTVGKDPPGRFLFFIMPRSRHSRMPAFLFFRCRQCAVTVLLHCAMLFLLWVEIYSSMERVAHRISRVLIDRPI